MSSVEWTAPFLDADEIRSLHAALALADLSTRPRREDYIELKVDKFHDLLIEVRLREHAPPHFHVSSSAGEASFAITDCRYLDGDFKGSLTEIRSWHRKNVVKLTKAWNSSRPSDCPVGPLPEPEA